ncbi:hypothetical protein [uncultured Paracoccus sp.]|uniref:hypothetical protein n=1 Tax=uncultured Paracoccus sp. TaxID=189685 RepID=UPI002591E63A|nr:hypothetical protein [uncultured Paracoccus sp.]
MPTFQDGTPLVQVRQLLNSTGLRKNDFTATEDPTPNYDSRFGWEVGSRIMSGGLEWICKDATVGAAVWVPAVDESAATLAVEAKAAAEGAADDAAGAAALAETAISDAAAADARAASAQRAAGVTPADYGVMGNGADETAAIHAMLDDTTQSGATVNWGSGEYRFSRYLCPHAAPRVSWRGKGARLISNDSAPLGPSWEDDYFLNFRAAAITTEQVAETMVAGQTHLELSAGLVDQVVPGETLLSFASTRVIETDDRGQARHGYTVGVARVVNGTTVELERPVPVTMIVGDIGPVAITAVDAGSLQLTVGSLAGEDVSDMRYYVQFDTVAGNPSTARAYPGEFDPATGTFTLRRDYPAGLQAGDIITIRRRIDVTLHYSTSVDIEGVVLERAPHLDANPGDLGFRGLKIYRAYKPRVRNVKTFNFSECGIFVSYSFAPEFSDQEHHGCNRAYNVFDGTGYGVTVYQSGFGSFERISGFGCRRVLDFSGTQSVSYDNITSDIVGYGGGTAYTGDLFWPSGSMQQSVVGSHGPAKGTVYRNTRGVDVYTIISMRGSDEVVNGVYGAGRINCLVLSHLGDAASIEDLYYTDGRPDWLTNPDLNSKYTRNGKLDVAVMIRTRNINPVRPHHIHNAVIRGLHRAFIACEDGGAVGPVSVGGLIDLTIDNEIGDRNDFDFVKAIGIGTPTLNGPVWIGPVTIRNKPSAPKTLVQWFNQANFNFAQGSYIRLPGGQYIVNIPDDGVVSLPAVRGIGAARCSIYALNRDRNFALLDGLIWTGRAGDKAPVPNATNVDVLSTELTGTTGADGHLSVSLTPGTHSALFIENRFGSAQLIQIDCNLLL